MTSSQLAFDCSQIEWYINTMGRYNQRKAKKRIKLKTLSTNKTLDKITYSPDTHKQKFTRELRDKLQRQQKQIQNKVKSPVSELKFGSFNINGIDIESAAAVEHILQSEGFDVC